MSKLLEKLEQLSKGNSKPMGFAAAAARSKLASMVIIAAVDDNDKAAAIVGEYADAVLVSSLAGKETAAASKLPWGVNENSAERAYDDANPFITIMKDFSDCDFILLNIQNSPIFLLQVEDLCRMIEIGDGEADSVISAINQLPIDILLIGGDTTISMKRLILCQRVANLANKHLFVRIPPETSREDLRELWETGITGVVVPVTGDDKKGLAALREAVDTLPSLRRKRGLKTSATIPSIAPAAPAEHEEPDEDE